MHNLLYTQIMEWYNQNTWKIRRIFKDIEYLESMYQQVKPIYEDDSENQPILRIESNHPHATTTMDSVKVPANITILYKPNYPFESISVYIDGTNYEDTVIATHLPRVLHWLNYYSKEYYIDIFYCKDFLKLIWSPVIRIPHIFVEIECINRIKRMVGYSILLDRGGYLPSELIPYLLSFIF